MRKHNLKRTRVKQPLEQIVVKAATTERSVVTAADGTIVVKKGTPAVTRQGRAKGSTKTAEFGQGKNGTPAKAKKEEKNR